jgi:hypothetical protein
MKSSDKERNSSREVTAERKRSSDEFVVENGA